MPASSLGRRRPRPVADAPALAGGDLAKAWWVELVAIAPLERAADLPGPRFAEDAPRLCEAVAAALASEAAFDDLEPGGPLAPVAAAVADLAGARDTLEAITALEALRATLWAATVAALDRPTAATIADLADRLAAILSTLTAAALEHGGPTTGVRPQDRGLLAAVLRGREDATSEDRTATPTTASSGTPAATPPPEDPLPASTPAENPLSAAARRSDPLAASTPARDPLSAAGPSSEPPAAAEDEPPLAIPPGDLSVSRLYGLVGDDPASRIEDATEFSARRLAPWTAAIERRLIRHREDGRPFAVLCVELVDVDRLVAADRDGDVTEVLEAAEAAMCAQLRPADALVRERPGRYWLTTPESDTAEARVLAHRIVAGVAAAPGHHGVPLQAAIGLAACPTDGTDAGILEARAEEGVFAARAAGVRVAGD